MATHHRTYHSRRSRYDRFRHALDGQDAMCENASHYLRRPQALSQNEFDQYVKGAQFFPVADHTLRAMLGLALRKPPVITVPKRLEPMLNHASYDGNSIEVLPEDVQREILSIGRCCALLDMPQEGNSILTTP